MVWDMVHLPSGMWLWWARFPSEWTAWVIDDSAQRRVGTEYRIAVSVGTVTFFFHGAHPTFREAKQAAMDRTLQMQAQPLGGTLGHFSKKVTPRRKDTTL
jgi:hypothetical protein